MSTALSIQQLSDLELVVQRVSGLVRKASNVAARSEHLPCLDQWASLERLARLDDAVFAGQRLLVRLGADW